MASQGSGAQQRLIEATTSGCPRPVLRPCPSPLSLTSATTPPHALPHTPFPTRQEEEALKQGLLTKADGGGATRAAAANMTAADKQAAAQRAAGGEWGEGAVGMVGLGGGGLAFQEWRGGGSEEGAGAVRTQRWLEGNGGLKGGGMG